MARLHLLASTLFAALCLLMHAAPAAAGPNEDRTIQAAHEVLQQFQQLQIPQIPESLLANVHAVAIIPDVIKLGFVVGGQRGHGVIVVREVNGAWRAPLFVTITGGSIGWQAGAQATDFVLVFKSQKSVDGLMRGTFTLGADAAIAAGPVGRRAGAATDAELKAEIYSYSRTRGLFAGVSLEGSALQVDDRANAAYYGLTLPGAPPPAIPPAAHQLVQIIAALATRTAAPAQFLGAPTTVPAAALEPIVGQNGASQAALARAATNLSPFLDEPWRRYLALPGEVYDPSRRPSPEAVAASLQRFSAVAGNPQYQSLTGRAEFQATYQSLQKLSNELRGGNSTQLALPPPPQSSFSSGGTAVSR
jgi:lipid-binding SYLF domain-containing protein